MRNDPSRDHLLAELMHRCFQRFAAHLDARQRIHGQDVTPWVVEAGTGTRPKQAHSSPCSPRALSAHE